MPNATPVLVPPQSFKQRLSFAGGWLICRFGPLRRRLLGTWTTPESRGAIENILFRFAYNYWWRAEYLAEPDPDRREALKAELMGGGAGAAWAAHYDAAPIDLDGPLGGMVFREACPLLPELDRILASASEQIVVLQIGSSSGRELGWLAERHPAHSFVGLDLYQEVIEFASAHHRHSNLRFERATAADVPILAERVPGPLVVISSGALQYIQPEHLESMMARLARRPRTEALFLEPAEERYGAPDRLERSVWAGSLAYTHNYRGIAEGNGWRTTDLRLIRPYEPTARFPERTGTVHYFYRGVTSQSIRR